MKILFRMIDSCEDCGYSSNNTKNFDDDGWVCKKTGDFIDNLYTIPNWCPLPDGRREHD